MYICTCDDGDDDDVNDEYHDVDDVSNLSRFRLSVAMAVETFGL